MSAGATPCIILVRPQMGENIGAAARAMHNFGLTDLRIVSPRDGWPSRGAEAMASGADVVLDNATIFDDTAAALADLHRVFALSARRRDMIKPEMVPRAAVSEAAEAIAAGGRAGFLFGPERSGLENDDVVLADTVVTVPANPAFASINLAQAVLLIAYEWFQRDAEAAPVPARRLASKGELNAFLDRLEASLDAAGFFASVADKRPTMVRNIRNLFQRAALLEPDVRTLHGIIRALTGRPARGDDE